MSQDQACAGSDGGISDEGPTPDQLTYLENRFELVCHTKDPGNALNALRLFREPNLNSMLGDGTKARYVDLTVDQLVATDGVQFLGGSVYTPTRCPLVQRMLPDGKGGNTFVARWYMLSSDVSCELKLPGQE